MPRSQSDLSNTAIRIFLQEVGNVYDKERGFEVFKPSVKQKNEVHRFFAGACAYCGTLLDGDLSTLDHLIPLNRTALGLHAWGNVISCCRGCNKEKQFKGWVEFLKLKAGTQFSQRESRISEFVSFYGYKPELGLHAIARNLYEDVGEVGSTLIRLRLKQAEENIRAVLGKAV
ncbi:MAG: HNH endonuclease signature motif containing protein [Pseudomonadota bacterium]